jgi:hypothetical protein
MLWDRRAIASEVHLGKTAGFGWFSVFRAAILRASPS